jgi:plasmid stabilization system protein ParE
MRIRWTPHAAADMEGISRYLAENYPNYRHRTMRKLFDTIASLKQWPHRGRPGREVGTREILFPPTPYVAVYRVREDSV